MTDALLGILKRGQENGSVWLWEHNEPLDEEPRGFVLENVQMRVSMLWEIGNGRTDSCLVALAQGLCTYYPESVYGFSDLGSFYAAHEEHATAIEWFKKAYLIDSADVIVLANMARSYEQSGALDEARTMLNRIVAVGTPSDREYAKQRLERLK